MSKLLINPNLVTHIIITDFEDTEAIWRESVPEKKWFFGLVTNTSIKAGWYYEDHWGEWNLFESKNVTEIWESGVQGKLYYNPFLEIFAGKEKILGRHYKTIEEIKKICDKNFPNVKINM